jgi:hypothetical protein
MGKILDFPHFYVTAGIRRKSPGFREENELGAMGIQFFVSSGLKS